MANDVRMASIRMFKALPVTTHANTTIDMELAMQTLPFGFVFAPGTEHLVTDNLIHDANEILGRGSAEWNNSFHKSFAKVRESSMLRLRIEQMVHYLTTYGAELFGIGYHPDRVYIPHERVDIPELDADLLLIVIRGLTTSEMRSELLKLLNTGVALSQQTVDDAVMVAEQVSLEADEVNNLKNREVQAALLHRLNLVPRTPEAFLRYCIYQATGTALIIKNDALLSQLRDRRNDDIAGYFARYALLYGNEPLAQVFYRYKPIFLALRTNTPLRRQINSIRRLATVFHKPMPADYLNMVTAKIMRGETIQTSELGTALANANTFRKVRLAYALKYRSHDVNSILYRVRNGKGWATDFTSRPSQREMSQVIYLVVVDSIVNDMSRLVDGKIVYIPKGLVYALPATEKMFTGNLPTGSYADVENDLVVGIHWQDVGGHRIDLDLSLTNADGKIGWDGMYRDGGVSFSGDLTAAPPPHGASELYHFDDQVRGIWLMNVNYYNHSELHPVPFRILAASQPIRSWRNTYAVNPNHIVAAAHSTMVERHKTLGLVVAEEGRKRFYFGETQFMRGHSASVSKVSEQTREFMLRQFTDAISLNDVLEAAGATLIDENPDAADINLSPEVVDKTMLISLLSHQEMPVA